MKSLNKEDRKQLLHFLVAGTSAVLVDFLVYRLLLRLGLSASLAKGISYVAGAAVGFVINKLWTFDSKKGLAKEIPLYTVLYVCTAFCNAFVNRAVLLATNIELLAFLIATGVSMVLNFLGMKFFVFRKLDNAQQEEEP